MGQVFKSVEPGYSVIISFRISYLFYRCRDLFNLWLSAPSLFVDKERIESPPPQAEKIIASVSLENGGGYIARKENAAKLKLVYENCHLRGSHVSMNRR